MRFSLLGISLLLGVCACNPVPPLTNQEKAKFVFELIEDAHTCDGYRTRLSTPDLDGPTIDGIYQDAIRTKCIKRDV
jgi:hypothetical protein